MVIVVGKTVDHGFFILEMYKSWDNFRADSESIDELVEFLLLSLERGEVLLVARAENYLQLLLLDLFLNLVEFLEVGELIAESAD